LNGITAICIWNDFLLTIWFVGGIFHSYIIKKAKHLLTDEMMLIISLAMYLMVILLQMLVFSSIGRLYYGFYHCWNYAGRTYRTSCKTSKDLILQLLYCWYVNRS
jgi:hypothetical protein